jgi:hypothetical protein
MPRIEVTLRIGDSLHEQARRLARARGETFWDMVDRALRREIARIDRYGPTAGMAPPELVEEIEGASTWPELDARLGRRGLAVRADAGGITVYRLDDGARIDLPGRGLEGDALMRRLGPPPGEALLHWDRDRAEDPAVCDASRGPEVTRGAGTAS